MKPAPTLRAFRQLTTALIATALPAVALADPTFTGLLTDADGPRFSLVDGDTKEWVRLGGTFGAYTLERYDPAAQTLTLRSDSGELRLRLAPGQAAWAEAAVLETRSFIVEILHACEEGCVSCDQIRFRVTDKKSRRVTVCIGSTVHSTAADGVTPSAFHGYRFADGSVSYFVGEDGRMEMADGTGSVSVEQGDWRRGS